MHFGREAYVERARIAFVRLYALLLAVGEVVVYGLVKGFGELLNAFALEIHQSVDTLYFTEENVVLFAESHRTDVSFVV